MLLFEKKIIQKIEQHSHLFFFLIISMLGVVIRILGRKFISLDMSYFLKPWFEIIKAQGGLQGLSSQVGDYNILYQTIIALFTYISLDPVYLYKMLSCAVSTLLPVPYNTIIFMG